jgi:FkbM family methyltransferase
MSETDITKRRKSSTRLSGTTFLRKRTAAGEGQSSTSYPQQLVWCLVSFSSLIIIFLRSSYDPTALGPEAPIYGQDQQQPVLQQQDEPKNIQIQPRPSAHSVEEHIAFLRFMGQYKNIDRGTGWYVDILCLQKHKDRSVKPIVLYSAGCGDGISWEIDMIEEYEASVVLVDPTEQGARLAEFVLSTKEYGKDTSIIRFFPVALGDQDGEAVLEIHSNPHEMSTRSVDKKAHSDKKVSFPTRTLQSLMAEIGHDYIDILKIDSEGAEYDFLETLLQDDFMPFTQLLIEFHARSIKSSEQKRHFQLTKNLSKAGFVQLSAEKIPGDRQRRLFVKLRDLAYCDDGVSPRYPSSR